MAVTMSKILDSARLGVLNTEARRHGGAEQRKRIRTCVPTPLCLCVDKPSWGKGSRF